MVTVMFAPIRFLSIVVFGAALSHAVLAQTAQQQIQISATVPQSCTIGGSDTGVLDTATIPISASGAVVTAPITPAHSPYLSVACNMPSTLQLTSNEGGVKSGTTASGFSNIIDYQASATWNGVPATLDTSLVSSAAGPESGNAEPVPAGSGSLSVVITPEANTEPLVAGNYTDTLFVVLSPQ
jgi:hypothetical protein